MTLSVTAVVPAYNAGRFLGEALEAALAQTRPPDEILVVDDGSTDDTAAVAARFPVRVVRHERNLGAPATRNHLLRLADTELVAWLDADDVWDRDHLATVVPLLEQHASPVLAFASVRHIGTRSGVWTTWRLTPHVPVNAFLQSFECTLPPTSTLVARRQPLLDAGGFDEAFPAAQDFELCLRLARRWPFICTDRITASYRTHGNQISATPARQQRFVYLARLKMIRAVEVEGDEATATLLRSRLSEIWERELRRSWDSRDLARFRMLAALTEELPLQPSASRRLLWRRRIPAPMLAVWDNLVALRQQRRAGPAR